MRLVRKWSAVLMTVVMALSGTMSLYAAAGGEVQLGLKDRYIEIGSEEPDEDEENPDEDAVEILAPDPELPDDWEESSDGTPDMLSFTEDENNGVPTENRPSVEFAFAVANPGSENHNRWQDCSMTVGQVMLYDLYFVWYWGEDTQLGSTLEEDMGIGLTYEADGPFHLNWDEQGHHLEIAPTALGTYSLVLEYDHPGDGERAQFVMTIEVISEVIANEYEYVFVIAEPNSDNYRPWQDLTLEWGEDCQYDLYLARAVDGAYEIVSTGEFDMGIDLVFEINHPQFRLEWTGVGHRLVIQPGYWEPHTIMLTYKHPDSGKSVTEKLVVNPVAQRYFFVVAEPGSDDYRLWDDPTVQIGYQARYSLHLATLEGDRYVIDQEREWGIFFEESAHFTVDRESDGLYINACPTTFGTYYLDLYYHKPVSGDVRLNRLSLYVEQPPIIPDYFCTFLSPDGTLQYFFDGNVGTITVRYNGIFDPTQTLTYTSKEEWTLEDEEGSLELISGEPGSAVYAMIRPTWITPPVFRSGNTVLKVRILLPEALDTRFVLYDETLADISPQLLPELADDMLTPGEEAHIAIAMEKDGETFLVPDPVNVVRFSTTPSVSAQPGDFFFTIVPTETGYMTLSIEQDRKQTVWVGAKKSQRIFLIEAIKPNNGGMTRRSCLDGDNVKSGIFLSIDDAVPGQGLGSAFRSSNPDVLRVEPHETYDDLCYVRPVGFGEAVIYLEHERYEGQVQLVVNDWNINMTAIQFNNAWWGPTILPASELEGTEADPFVVSCITAARIPMSRSNPIDLWSGLSGEGQFTSSDPDVVEVKPENCFGAFLYPVSPGTCTITYREGPFVKEVVVRSEPGGVEHGGVDAPGFYTYYGSAQVRKDTLSLSDGRSALMAVALQAKSGTRAPLNSENLRFSNVGIAGVELIGDDLFRLVPLQDGVTTLTYTAASGDRFSLEVTVGLPQPVWDFVVPDDGADTGYRLWESTQAIAGERLEHPVYFAQVILASDRSIHSLTLTGLPDDIVVEAENGCEFELVQRHGTWYACAPPGQVGEHPLSITATPPGTSSPQTWVKHLYISDAIVVSENTVAAINTAIRNAPVSNNYETVILLPEGYIPMDGDTPVVLSRPVTLRGQNTVLASDIVVLSATPGARLQDLTIRLDENSCYNTLNSRTRYHYILLDYMDYDRPLFALFGNGYVTLENCELDGGTGTNQFQYGISIDGSEVTFQGANTIQNFSEAGWILYSRPGPRRYLRGLTLIDNKVGVKIIEDGSTDPYFIRLIESNFLNNTINVESDFPVNFSHNYFNGGSDAGNITKSPQYTQQLAFDGTNTPVQYPNLMIETEYLAFTEILNFEGQAPIDSTNFTQTDGTVLIAVKEFEEATVHEDDRSYTLLQWSFSPVAQNGDAVPFRPDAYIDEEFDLPPDSGIDLYQGVSFAHHGPLPMEGAEISVQKRVLFQEDTLYLYRLANGTLTLVGEIDNAIDEFYTFSLDGCSDYVITNVVVEAANGGDGDGDGGHTGGGNGSDGGDGDGGTGGGGGSDGGNGNGSTGGGSSSGGNYGSGDGNGSSDGNRPSNTTENTTDPIQNTSADSDSLAVESLPNYPQSPSISDRGTGSGFAVQPADVDKSDDARRFLYDNIYPPPNQNLEAASRGISANRYVDDAAILAAFNDPRDGQVVIDVGVKTTVSPLAFQLLADNPTHTLVLKGDGYEWRFSGETIRQDATPVAFDTAVSWQAAPDGGYARLSFAQQDALPGNCNLVLETTFHPREWVDYHAAQAHYLPCTMKVRQQGNHMTMQLDALGDFVAIL